MIFFKRKTKEDLILELGKAKQKARVRHNKELERQEKENIKQQIKETNSFAKPINNPDFLKGFKKTSVVVAKGVIATGKGLGSVLKTAEENRRANEKSEKKRGKKKKKKVKQSQNPFQF